IFLMFIGSLFLFSFIIEKDMFFKTNIVGKVIGNNFNENLINETNQSILENENKNLDENTILIENNSVEISNSYKKNISLKYPNTSGTSLERKDELENLNENFKCIEYNINNQCIRYVVENKKSSNNKQNNQNSIQATENEIKNKTNEEISIPTPINETEQINNTEINNTEYNDIESNNTEYNTTQPENSNQENNETISNDECITERQYKYYTTILKKNPNYESCDLNNESVTDYFCQEQRTIYNILLDLIEKPDCPVFLENGTKCVPNWRFEYYLNKLENNTDCLNTTENENCTKNIYYQKYLEIKDKPRCPDEPMEECVPEWHSEFYWILADNNGIDNICNIPKGEIFFNETCKQRKEYYISYLFSISMPECPRVYD
ncbi:MAG: hypothetical protein QXM96_03215, partial [Candidatus Woesearchaeota archaeon]